MEQVPAEEKIASIKKRFDEIDSSAVGCGSSGSGNGSGNGGGPPMSPAPDGNGLFVAAEFKKGKIADMKRQLSAKLDIDAAADTAGEIGDSVRAEKQRKPCRGRTRADLFVSPEFEKGKISAMKQSLVSEGLGLDGAAPAVREGTNGAAHDGHGLFEAPEFETGKIKAMKQELSSKGLGLDGALVTATAAASAAGGAGEKAGSSHAQPVANDVLVEPGDSTSGAPFFGPNVGSSASPPGEESPNAVPIPAEIERDGHPTVTDTQPAVTVPMVNASEKPSATQPEARRANAPANPTRETSPQPARRRSSTPDGQEASPSLTRPASTLPVQRRPTTGGSTLPESADRISPSPAAIHKPSTPQRGRQSSPARPKTAGPRIGDQRHSVGSPSLAAQRRRPSTSESRSDLPTSAEQRKSPVASQVSRAVATSLGHAELPAASGAGMAPHRRSSTPAKPRSSHVVVQRQMTTPVRPVAVGSGSPAVVTPSPAELAGIRLHDQARETRERLERRRREGASPAVSSDGLSPFTPRRWSNPRRGNPSLAGMERVERLYRDATERGTKLELARREEEENPRDCTFTPKITARASSRGRREGRGHHEGVASEGSQGNDGGSMSHFHALYLDAKHRREKMEALTDARIVEVAGPGSPVITALGRKRSGEPLDVRLKEDAERWVRRWKELEEKKAERDVEGCTFQPTFSVGRSASAPRLRGRGRDDSSTGSGNSEPFMVRAEKYLKAREKRLADLKREIEQKELAEATFQPKVTAAFAADGAMGGEGEGDQGRRSSRGGGSSRDSGVFERLLRAATEQEIHKAALKEEFLQNERERFHDFQPRLPTRRSDSLPRPLDARLRESTERWAQSREAREKMKLEQDAQQCTFRPSLGGVAAVGSPAGGSDRRARRRSSADPRPRAFTTGAAAEGATAVAGVTDRRTSMGAFEARSKAFQEAREQRLQKLRKEKMRRELQEATFHPIIGFGAGVAQQQSHIRTSSAGAGSGGVKGERGVATMNLSTVPASGEGAGASAVMGNGDMSEGGSIGVADRAAVEIEPAAQNKVDAGMAERKEGSSKAKDESASFKPQTHGHSASAASPKTSADGQKQTPRVEQNAVTDAVSSRKKDAAKQGPSPQQSSPYKARPKNEAHGGVGDTATAQQQTRRGRQQTQAVMNNGNGTKPFAAVAAVDAAVTPAGTASNKSVVPKRGAGAKEKGGTSGQRTNGASRGGGGGGGGDGGVQKKGDRGVDVDELSARLQQLADTSASTAVYDDKNDKAGGKTVANGDSKGGEQQQQQQQKLKQKPGQQDKPQLDNAPPPSPAPLSNMPSTSGAAGGEEGEQEADNVHEGQMVEQQRADELEAISRASPGAEDSEAESVPESPRAQVEDERESDEEQLQKDDLEEQEDTEEEEADVDDSYYDDDQGSESEGEGYEYSNTGHASGCMADQTTRSLEDFDQIQREIEAKLRAL